MKQVTSMERLSIRQLERGDLRGFSRTIPRDWATKRPEVDEGLLAEAEADAERAAAAAAGWTWGATAPRAIEFEA